MTRLITTAAAVLATALLLPACGERSQAEPARVKKADAKASVGAAGEAKVYTAAGWTPGDDASWQNQIRSRTQGQNEYSRSTSAAGPAAKAP
jgi:DMSO/TMAO reductase YedYZ molybdopterin-dependent catalytic subunit